MQPDVQTANYSDYQLLLTAAESVSYSHWHIALSFKADTELEAYKGNILHGGFGRALASVNPELYRCLFAQQDGNNRKACPFMIYCTDTSQSHYAAAQTLVIELRLFAVDNGVLEDIRQALLAWQKLGLGEKRTRFDILSISNNQGLLLYHISQGKLVIPAPQSIAAKLKARLQAIPMVLWNHQQATYHLSTSSRCRIQRNSQPLKQVPPADIWIKAIKRRFCGLLADDYAQSDLKQLQALSSNVKAVKVILAAVQFSDWQKYSVKDNRKVSIGGLVGRWGYRHVSVDSLIWLLIGEYIGIGNKTSFGFGCYSGIIGFSKLSETIRPNLVSMPVENAKTGWQSGLIE